MHNWSKEMSKTITVRLDESTYKKIKAAAESERRPISNYIEFATVSFIDNSLFIEDEEMNEIKGNKKLIDNLKRSIDDIKNADYRIVE